MKLNAPASRFYLAFLLFFISKSGLAQVEFDRFEESSIHFNRINENGKTTHQAIKTNLLDLNYLGALKPDEGDPYFLVSAKPCQNCSEDRSIYAIRPSNLLKPTSFVYPGKIFDPKSRALLLESRAFFGKCLPHKGDVFVVFQKEKVDRRSKLQTSVLIVEAAKDFLTESLKERNLPSLTTTLKLVKKKQCQEIDGRNRLMSSKPIDLKTRGNFILTEEEEED